MTARLRRRRPRWGRGRPVVLWVDTFSNHFQPQVAHAAVTVLEAAGFDVRVPGRSLCCGRPLCDHGMLDTAHRYVDTIVCTLREDIEAGVPVVGLEPSCVAVFRGELSNLRPRGESARRLASQTYTLSQLLDRYAATWRPPRLEVDALVQGHDGDGIPLCRTEERALLGRMGVRTEIANDEQDTVSAVREADPATVVVADGFSARQRIGQLTERTAVHLAELLAFAVQGRCLRVDAGLPEEQIRAEPSSAPGGRRSGFAPGPAVVGLAASVASFARFAGRRT